VARSHDTSTTADITSTMLLTPLPPGGLEDLDV